MAQKLILPINKTHYSGLQTQTIERFGYNHYGVDTQTNKSQIKLFGVQEME